MLNTKGPVRDISQLPYLVRLLEDESPTIQEKIFSSLKLYGPDLLKTINDHNIKLNPKQKILLDEFILEKEEVPGIKKILSLFEPGDLITHNKHHYRGVIIEMDSSCQADDNWYNSNKTQPNKDQPWYHILVHNSMAVTYAAQSNLTLLEDKKPVKHPLLDIYFSELIESRYLRNNTPWPGWS